jgi:neutral amino acid transport system substrate-binding protein
LLIDEQIPTALITPSATSSSLTNFVDRFDPETDPFGLLWRTCASDSLQGKALAELIDGQQLKKPIVIFQRDTYGQGLEETFRIELTALGGSAASVPFEVDESDLASAVNASTGVANADSLLIISNDAGRTLRVLAEVANKAALVALPLFLTDGSKDQTVLLDPTAEQAVKDLVAKAQGTAPASPTTPEYQTFATNLKGQFGTDPEGFAFVANSYDATYAAVYALLFALDREDRSDGFDVAEGLSRLTSGEVVPVGPTAFTTGVAELVGAEKTLDLEGTSGHLSFDSASGDTPADIEVWKVSADYASFEVVSVIPY